MNSNVLNYQAKLISLLSDFLKTQSIGNKTVTNYLSDLRHFFVWFTKTSETRLQGINSEVMFAQLITSSDIESYRGALIGEQTPTATINRRLSALRAFGKFLVSEGWITRNPAEQVQNIAQKSSKILTGPELLNEFETYLRNEGAADSTTKAYKADAETFLKWLVPNE